MLALNDVGKIVEEEWLKTPTIRSNVALDDYVIMPNHLHGIVIINDVVGATRRVAPTKDKTTLRPNSLGAIIGQFKSSVPKRLLSARLLEKGTLWQRNYYEHIIRNDSDLTRIRTYIANNPLQWAIDEENPNNTKS